MELTDSQREVLELASDELEWEEAYMQAGPKYATELIFKQAERDILAGLTIEVVLSRFYIKMRNLDKQVLKEKRKTK